MIKIEDGDFCKGCKLVDKYNKLSHDIDEWKNMYVEKRILLNDIRKMLLEANSKGYNKVDIKDIWEMLLKDSDYYE